MPTLSALTRRNSSHGCFALALSSSSLSRSNACMESTRLSGWLQDLKLHAGDEVRDAATVLQHVRRGEMRTQGIEALPLFDDGDHVRAEWNLAGGAAGQIHGWPV